MTTLPNPMNRLVSECKRGSETNTALFGGNTIKVRRYVSYLNLITDPCVAPSIVAGNARVASSKLCTLDLIRPAVRKTC